MRGKARPPAQVVQVFEQLVNEALDRSAIWLQDWCWSDLLGMLGWDHQAVRVTLQQLQKIAAALAPRVIYCASIRVWRFCEPSKNGGRDGSTVTPRHRSTAQSRRPWWTTW